MNAFKKTVLACSIAAASVFASSAMAAPINDFKVTPPGGGANSTFTADRIGGGYTEVATFDTTNNTFNVSLLFTAGQFFNDGTAYEAGDVGLGVNYNLYGTYKASGTFSVAGGITTFNFTPGTGALKLFLDAPRNTKFSTAIKPSNGSGDFTIVGSGDDVVLADGTALSGEGSLNPGLSTCGASGINCGSFGSKTTFSLTPAGSAFFVAPSPFYNLSFQSGQLTTFVAAGTQTISGTMDVTFDGLPTDVPEPASIALLGLGLLGLGMSRRRKQK